MTIRILTGDVRERLADLSDASVQCVVTSPPYYGLRSYGTEPQVWGGDPECDHEWTERRYYVAGGGGAQKSGEGFSEPGDANAQRIRDARWRDDGLCVTCGAWLGHLSHEPTLAMFVEHLVAVFRDVRRVLRDDGTCWLNLGDSYAAQRGGTHQPAETLAGGKGGYTADGERVNRSRHDGYSPTRDAHRLGFKHKDLMMVPARVAIALQDDGWWLRSDIIWAKKNCMPESVTDRPTSSHEHIFLLTKSARYYYDADAVREEAEPASIARINQATFDQQTGGPKDYRNGVNSSRSMRQTLENFALNPGRNQRNVWHLATEPFPEAHFATFPSEIPRRCIKAGTSEKGQCPACGAPWVRVVERKQYGSWHDHSDDLATGQRQESNQFKGNGFSDYEPPKTTGWQPSCTCDAGEPVPQTVLDPFLGSGTTLLVADQLGRHGAGIELNPEYARMAERRIRGNAPMFAQVAAD